LKVQTEGIELGITKTVVHFGKQRRSEYAQNSRFTGLPFVALIQCTKGQLFK